MAEKQGFVRRTIDRYFSPGARPQSPVKSAEPARPQPGPLAAPDSVGATSAEMDSTTLEFRFNRPQDPRKWKTKTHRVANNPKYGDHPAFKGPGSQRSDRAASLDRDEKGNLLDRIRDHGIADRLGVEPEALAAVIHHESLGDPAAENQLGYVGILQWSPGWRANWLGRSRTPVYKRGKDGARVNTTPAEAPLGKAEDDRFVKAMKNMTLEQQLDLVEDYFNQSSWHKAQQPADVGDIYRAVHAGHPRKTATDGISRQNTNDILRTKVMDRYNYWKGEPLIRKRQAHNG